MDRPALDASLPCPLCSGHSASVAYAFPTNPWLPGTVVECDDCGFLFKQPDGGPAAVDALYQRLDLAGHEYWDGEDAAGADFQEILSFATRGRPRRGRLLDVGCGPGTFAKLAAESGFEVTGLEPNQALADRARAAANVPVIAGDLTSAEIDPESFDVICMLDLIEHLVDPRGALLRVRRLLAPGGQLVVYTPNHAGAIVRFARMLDRRSGGRINGPVTEIFDGPHVAFFDPTSLRTVLGQAGFDVVATTSVRYEPSRSQQASKVAAAGLRLIESVSPLAGGRFRTIALAQPRAHGAGSHT